MAGHGYGLLTDIRIEKIYDEVADGTSVANSTEVDTANAAGVIFIVLYGTSAVDNGIHIEQAPATGMAGAADLEGSEKLLDGVETVCISQVHKPRERFLRAAATRATSTTIPAGFAIVYGLRNTYDNGSDTDNAVEALVSPAEGTK